MFIATNASMVTTNTMNKALSRKLNGVVMARWYLYQTDAWSIVRLSEPETNVHRFQKEIKPEDCYGSWQLNDPSWSDPCARSPPASRMGFRPIRGFHVSPT